MEIKFFPLEGGATRLASYVSVRFAAESLQGSYLVSEPITGFGEVLWRRIAAACCSPCVSSTSPNSSSIDRRGVSHASSPLLGEGPVGGGPRSRH